MTIVTAQPYCTIRVKLPVFVVLALRLMVADANTDPTRDMSEPPWTVDKLLEKWLLNALTSENLEKYAKQSPEFKRETEAWLRWVAREAKLKAKSLRK